jgi:hypothetical protein
MCAHSRGCQAGRQRRPQPGAYAPAAAAAAAAAAGGAATAEHLGAAQAGPARQQRTSIPWCVLWPKDDGVPQHDVVRIGRAIHPLGWILPQALEVPHQALHTCAQRLQGGMISLWCKAGVQSTARQATTAKRRPGWPSRLSCTPCELMWTWLRRPGAARAPSAPESKQCRGHCCLRSTHHNGAGAALCWAAACVLVQRQPARVECRWVVAVGVKGDVHLLAPVRCTSHQPQRASACHVSVRHVTPTQA